MRRRDDSFLPPDRLRAVKKEATRILKEADALGTFPTPIEQLLQSSKVILADEDAFHESLVRRFRRRFGNRLKRALSKVRGILDATARIVYIDYSLPTIKQAFLKLHEMAHSFLPWQRPLYGAFEDCDKTIEPAQADAFEREANVFASEVLFQCETFSAEAADHEFGILTPVRLSKKYGASIYSAVRRYVRTNNRACAVLVLNMPELAERDGFVATLRRVEISLPFSAQFGDISWPDCFTPDDQIGAMVPTGRRRMSRPRLILLNDVNGDTHECVAEAFTQTYQVFVLIHPSDHLVCSSIIVPASSIA
jgi:Zn-dependent peptidase ImmA (M78 family)